MPIATQALCTHLADLRERFNSASDSLPPLPCLLVQVKAQSSEGAEFRRRFDQGEKLARLTAESYTVSSFLYQVPRCGLEGIVSPALTRSVLIEGTKAALDRFAVLSTEAGKHVTALGDDVSATVSRNSIANSAPTLRWVYTIFDLAWGQAEESPLTAPRHVCVDGRFVRYDPDGWRPFLDLDASDPFVPSKAQLRELVEHPPDCFSSEMPDLMRASVHAIDVMTESLGRAQRARAGESIVVDDRGVSDGDKGVVRWTWQEARKKGEKYVLRDGYPGLRDLGRKIGGCPSTTMAKAIKKSKLLTARKAEHKRAGATREVQLSQMDLDNRPQTREQDTLQSLIDEQKADTRQERRVRPRTNANTRER